MDFLHGTFQFFTGFIAAVSMGMAFPFFFSTKQLTSDRFFAAFRVFMGNGFRNFIAAVTVDMLFPLRQGTDQLIFQITGIVVSVDHIVCLIADQSLTAVTAV
jgi:hypothetical protein